MQFFSGTSIYTNTNHAVSEGSNIVRITDGLQADLKHIPALLIRGTAPCKELSEIHLEATVAATLDLHSVLWHYITL